MNANSSNDEPKTEPDTLQDMSEGARMLIERMKTHPDEFKEGGRFYFMLSGVGVHRSRRDRDALEAAYDKLIAEPTFTEQVFGMIFNKDEYNYKYVKAQGQFQKWTDPRALYGQREDLRVSVGENGVNQIQALSHNQSILAKIKSKLS